VRDHPPVPRLEGGEGIAASKRAPPFSNTPGGSNRVQCQAVTSFCRQGGAVLTGVDPEPFRWTAWLFLTAHVAQLLRGILGIVELSTRESAMHGVIALAITCGLVVWATTRSRWRET